LTTAESILCLVVFADDLRVEGEEGVPNFTLFGGVWQFDIYERKTMNHLSHISV